MPAARQWLAVGLAAVTAAAVRTGYLWFDSGRQRPGIYAEDVAACLAAAREREVVPYLYGTNAPPPLWSWVTNVAVVPTNAYCDVSLTNGLIAYTVTPGRIRFTESDYANRHYFVVRSPSYSINGWIEARVTIDDDVSTPFAVDPVFMFSMAMDHGDAVATYNFEGSGTLADAGWTRAYLPVSTDVTNWISLRRFIPTGYAALTTNLVVEHVPNPAYRVDSRIRLEDLTNAVFKLRGIVRGDHDLYLGPTVAIPYWFDDAPWLAGAGDVFSARDFVYDGGYTNVDVTDSYDAAHGLSSYAVTWLGGGSNDYVKCETTQDRWPQTQTQHYPGPGVSGKRFPAWSGLSPDSCLVGTNGLDYPGCPDSGYGSLFTLPPVHADPGMHSGKETWWNLHGLGTNTYVIPGFEDATNIGGGPVVGRLVRFSRPRVISTNSLELSRALAGALSRTVAVFDGSDLSYTGTAGVAESRTNGYVSYTSADVPGAADLIAGFDSAALDTDPYDAPAYIYAGSVFQVQASSHYFRHDTHVYGGEPPIDPYYTYSRASSVRAGILYRRFLDATVGYPSRYACASGYVGRVRIYATFAPYRLGTPEPGYGVSWGGGWGTGGLQSNATVSASSAWAGDWARDLAGALPGVPGMTVPEAVPAAWKGGAGVAYTVPDPYDSLSLSSPIFLVADITDPDDTPVFDIGVTGPPDYSALVSSKDLSFTEPALTDPGTGIITEGSGDDDSRFIDAGVRIDKIVVVVDWRFKYLSQEPYAPSPAAHTPPWLAP